MRLTLLVFLSAIGLALGQSNFECRNLLPNGFVEAQRESGNGGFRIELSPNVQQVRNGDEITVRVISSSDAKFNFILQARQYMNPVGYWKQPSPDTATTRCEVDQDTVEALSDVDSAQAVWTASSAISADNGDIEFVATIVSVDGKFYKIQSSTLTKFDVHNDPSEWVEEGQPGDEEQEGGADTGDETGENPNGGEDPTDAERREEEERQETLDRDNAGQDPDHGLTIEINLMLQQQKKQDELNAMEDQNGESEWDLATEQRRREDEEERQWEMWKYEHDQEEYERKRQEMIRWEMQDKEEHDRVNDTPKDDDTKDDSMEKPGDNEVDLGEDKLIVNDCPTCGGVSVVSSFLTLALMFITLYLL